MIAHSVKIETDERGFVLIIEHDGIPAYLDESTLYLRLEDPEQLYAAVRADIGPWIQEKADAHASFVRTFACDPDESAGLADLGPKHPEFHSVHVDHYDNRDKTGGRTF